MPKKVKTQADFIEPLIINGLKGRVLKVPASSKVNRNNEVLIIYGHHSSLERMFGIAESIALHGNVTMPDLPGFGGMDSFYSINETPNLDNLADYLATFIKLNYKKKKISIGAMSFGFLIVTRMLQKYPKLTKQVNVLVSIVGFSNKNDFRFKKRTWVIFRYLSAFCSTKTNASFIKYALLRPSIIRTAYTFVADRHVKMKDADETERQKRIEFEIELWKSNDIRTYMYTSKLMLMIDLTKNRVDLPLYHVSIDQDQYFYSAQVKLNLKKIYKSVKTFKAKLPNHAPTVISNANDAKPFIPDGVRKELLKAARLKNG
jgi:pimeloyl-ACP methyl ester carboxylesterase